MKLLKFLSKYAVKHNIRSNAMSEDNFRVEKGAENQPVNEAQNNGGKDVYKRQKNR